MLWEHICKRSQSHLPLSSVKYVDDASHTQPPFVSVHRNYFVLHFHHLFCVIQCFANCCWKWITHVMTRLWALALWTWTFRSIPFQHQAKGEVLKWLASWLAMSSFDNHFLNLCMHIFCSGISLLYLTMTSHGMWVFPFLGTIMLLVLILWRTDPSHFPAEAPMGWM